jgi:hypothetical protein
MTRPVRQLASRYTHGLRSSLPLGTRVVPGSAARLSVLLICAIYGCGVGVIRPNDNSVDAGDVPDGSAGADAAGPSADGPLADGALADGAPAPDGGCPAGLVECGDGCADLQVDHAHCGTCNRPCAATEECQGGACAGCVDECPAGARECSGDGWRACGEHDGDSCLEWSAVVACPAGCDPASATCNPSCGSYCAPFSIVLMPDTQYYTSKQADGAANTYRKQTTWIRDHRTAESIQTAIHLGDITDNNTASQWTIADHAHEILDAADVPYSVLPGNHDYRTASGWGRSDSLFDAHFPASRFAGRPWYGGPLGSSNTNNYTLFEVGPMKFLVVSLEYAPRKDEICLAEDVIAGHPDRRVIIATHCYLTTNGAYANCPADEYLTLGADGATLWNELVSRHSNIFLVASGHVGESAHVARAGNSGNAVHQLVVDYQFEAACTAASAAACTDHCRAGTYTGNGWLRQMVFDPAQNEVRSRTFSVEDGNAAFFPGGAPRLFCSELNTQGEGRYSSDPLAADHDFSFSYDLSSTLPYARNDLGRRAFLDRTVNSAGAGDQLAPRVAMSASGAFVVVWEDDSSSADGAGNHDIMARGFAPGGCGTFADLPVNTTTAGQQRSPAVAADDAGNFVVAWEDDADGNGSFQVHARGFLANGTQRFPTFTVNSTATGQQVNPAIGMAPDGRFVIAWEDAPAGDGQYQIWMRGFNADGSQRFADRSVHPDVAGKRIAAALDLDSSAQFVVTWQDDSDGNGSYQIHARGFNADGTERFATRTVNSVATGQQRRPAIGLSDAGLFVVAWEDDQDGDGSSQIRARGFNADGSPRLADFDVPGPVSGNRVRPALAMCGDGAFIVTWQDDSDGNGSYQIHARAFHADGSEWKARWTVNRQDSGQQSFPHVGVAARTTVVVWQDDMDGNGSYQILARGVDLP